MRFYVGQRVKILDTAANEYSGKQGVIRKIDDDLHGYITLSFENAINDDYSAHVRKQGAEHFIEVVEDFVTGLPR